jgi:predicted esterase
VPGDGDGRAAPRPHHLTVRRTARYWTLGPPAATAAEVWLVVHGYAQLAGRFIRRFARLDDGTRRIIAPEALSRFYLGDDTGAHGPDARIGATWMTREDRLAEIEDYIAYLDALHDAELGGRAGSLPVVALGFSQGVATVCRWAARTERPIEHVILWAGALPPELEPRPDLFRGARLTLVHGTADPLVDARAVAAHAARLATGGLAAAVIRYDGGHTIDDAVLDRLAAARG